jgi:hypothetical protein
LTAAELTANLDATGVEPNFITGIKEPFGIAVNSSAIFWASLESKAIGRANLDGGGKNFGLVTGAGTALCGIAIDSGHIYWGNTGFLGGHADEIGRVNINGTGIDKSIIGEAEGPCGLTINGSKLYWANQGTDTIGVANTDATGGSEICGVAVDSGYTPITTPTDPGSGSSGAPGSSSPPPPSPPPPGTVKVAKVKNDKKKGTARVDIAVNEAGSVKVSGKGAVAAKATAKGGETVAVLVKAAKSKRATLKKAGSLKVKLTIKFAPSNGGAAASTTKSFTLRKQ